MFVVCLGLVCFFPWVGFFLFVFWFFVVFYFTMYRFLMFINVYVFSVVLFFFFFKKKDPRQCTSDVGVFPFPGYCCWCLWL